MSKQVILTGLRPNNDLHVGNYFGALMAMVDMAKSHADDFEVNLMIADLHAFVTPIDHSKLAEQITHTAKLFAAAGLPLDHQNIRIFRQSHVPAHSELTWILNNFTGVGEMERMTQYKDKSAKLGTDRINLGLLDYPVLQAVDILLYDASYVPVGDDQTQHLEFTRDIAERMNNKFGELFVVPEPVAKQHEFFDKEQGLRIKDLVDPTKKMSKSEESDRGIIFLGDNPEDAAKKIMSATTDSFGSIHRSEDTPGISNLLQILALIRNEDIVAVTDKYHGQSNYGNFKKDVAVAVKAFLADFQQRLASVDEAALMQKLQSDEALMNEKAGETLLRVQKAIGLR